MSIEDTSMYVLESERMPDANPPLKRTVEFYRRVFCQGPALALIAAFDYC